MKESVLKKSCFDMSFWLSNLAYIVSAVFVVIFGITHPVFLSAKNIISLFTQTSILLLVSCGMSLAMITKGMDRSVGSIMLISAAVMWKMFDLGMGIVVICLSGIIVGALVGIFNGFLAAYIPIYPLLTTLTTMYIARGIGLSIIGGGPRSMPQEWSFISQTKIFTIPLHVFISITIAALLQFFLSNTGFGRYIYAVGDNEKTATEKGINVVKVKIVVYMLGGLLCALGSFISTSQVMAATPTIGTYMESHAVIAAVLGGVSLAGGKGNLFPGVVVGSLIMSIISNALVIVGAPANMYNVIYGLVIFIVILLDVVRTKIEK